MPKIPLIKPAIRTNLSILCNQLVVMEVTYHRGRGLTRWDDIQTAVAATLISPMKRRLEEIPFQSDSASEVEQFVHELGQALERYAWSSGSMPIPRQYKYLIDNLREAARLHARTGTRFKFEKAIRDLDKLLDPIIDSLPDQSATPNETDTSEEDDLGDDDPDSR